MNSPRTFTQIKWLAIFLAAFFTMSGFVGYSFVKAQVNRSLLTGLSASADEIVKAIHYQGGTINIGNIREYNNTLVDAIDYFVVLSDGYLFDNGTGAKGIPPELLPEVEFTGDEKLLYAKPIQYLSPLGEHWHLFAKHLIGGRVILGISELDGVVDPDTQLLSSATYFSGSTKEAARVSITSTKLNPSLHYAVIDDSGALVAGFDRMPLKTNAYVLGTLGIGATEKTLGGTPYLLWLQPIYDNAHKVAGTVIIFQDVTLEHHALWQQFIFNMGVAVISWIVLFIFGFRYWSKKESEKREIRETFQHYFSPQVMEAILKDPEKLKLGGERREVTILFSDIRSFTSMTESLPPQVLTRLLHEYFSEMTEEVLATDGIVDKYIGDAIMAFWGAPIPQPDQANRAVTTALNMIRRLKTLQEKWKKEGYPELDIGIGINLGVATVGNFGSTKRFDYTVIGDAVNAASRIEGLNKQYKSNIIISESTKRQLTLKLETEDLGEVPVKGKEKPIRIFRVLGLGDVKT